MLIQYYLNNKEKIFNNINIVSIDTIVKKDIINGNQNHIIGKYKNLMYSTGPLSDFDNLIPKDIFYLFDLQYETIKKEADIMMKYGTLSKKAYDITLEQYQNFFYHEEANRFYSKQELKEYISRQRDQINTITTKQIQQESTKQPTQTIQLQSQQSVTISRQAIRNITGYSPYFSPKRDKNSPPIYVKRQEDLVKDQHDLILVLGSRQIGKSYSIAEKCIEESYIPNNDILVGAFVVASTDMIKNYILKFIQEFPEGTFIENKQKNYIQNMETGSKIWMKTLADDSVDGARGLTLNTVIIDEAQKVSRYAFEEVLEPTLATTGGKMILIGTSPKNLSGHFVEQILKFKRGELDYASYYEIPLTAQPFTHPKMREKVMNQQDKPHIRREWFCSLENSDEKLFNIKLASEFPQLYDENSYYILAIDPARRKDGSGYSIHYVYNGKSTLVQSGYVPKEFKGTNDSQGWKMQCIFFQRLMKPYQYKKNIITVMDSTGVGDGVVTIFNDNGVKINYTVRYTSGVTQSNSLMNYTVSKSILINNLLDFIDEDLIYLVDITNKDLLEELKFIEEKETKDKRTTMTSKYLDDITNSVMIGSFIIKEKKLLQRSLGNLFKQASSPLTKNDMIDGIEVMRNKPKKKKTLSSVW